MTDLSLTWNRWKRRAEEFGALAVPVANDLDHALRLLQQHASGLTGGAAAGPQSADFEAALEQLATISRRLHALEAEAREDWSSCCSVAELESVFLDEGVVLEPSSTPAEEFGLDCAEFAETLYEYACSRRSAGARKFRARIELDSAEPPSAVGRTARICVQDDGPTLSASQLEDVLRPAWAAGGRGLAHARVVALALRTRAQARFPEGNQLVLEVVSRPPARVVLQPIGTPPQAVANGRVAQQRPTVLVVDDNGPIRALIVHALQAADFTVLEAARGESAIELATEYLQPIQVLVTDVVMPDMRGTELAGWMHQMHPNLSVIYVSGYGQVDLEHERPGTRSFPKPIDLEQLVSTVRELIAQSS